MSARDELEDLIWQNGSSATGARAILAAGYRKPRTVTTAEELDALPVGAVVTNLDSEHVAVKTWLSKHPRKDGTPLSEWMMTGTEWEKETSDMILPATVLYEPSA